MDILECLKSSGTDTSAEDTALSGNEDKILFDGDTGCWCCSVPGSGSSWYFSLGDLARDTDGKRDPLSVVETGFLMYEMVDLSNPIGPW